MNVLIWLGTGLSLIGLGGLVWCIVITLKAKRANLPDAELRAKLKQFVPLNLGSLLISALGLMMIIVAKLLG